MRYIGLGLGLTNGTIAGLHPDTKAWAAAVKANSGNITSSQLSSVNAQVVAINKRGLRSTVKRFNPMVGDAAAIVVPVYKDWGNAGNDTRTGVPTTDYRGLKILNTTGNYLDTGVIPSTAPGCDTKNFHMGYHVTEGNVTGADIAFMGCSSSAGTQRLGLEWSNASSVINVYFGVTGELLIRNSRTLGGLSGHRLMYATSGVTNYWENGVSVIATSTNPTGSLPTTSIWVGNANGRGKAGDGVYSGYHIGSALTTQQASDWSEIMCMGAQMSGRQETWLAVGDSLTSSGTWHSILQTNTLPRRSYDIVATGGIGTATMLGNIQAAIAANTSLKWRNVHIWGGQNDSSAWPSWDGSNTLANIASMKSLFPHQSYRIAQMIYQNNLLEYAGQPKRAVKDSVSSSFVSTYGAKARPYQTVLDNGGTGTGQDLIDFTNGPVTPSSLKKRLVATNISAITIANPCVITLASAPATPYIVGDVADLAAITGTVELNGQTVQITATSDTTHITINRDSTLYTVYVSGGTCTQVDATHINPAGDALVAADLGTSIAGGW